MAQSAITPRFAWRGMSFDVCRHFFPKEVVLRLIDVLALYRFNVLHFHLSDDQGFRVESERFPLLNSVGSFRKSSAVKRGAGEVQDNIPHGGFYTKADIRQIVAYAAAKGIDVVPELEMPGHALAMIAAYPELACTGEPVSVATSYGIKDFSSHILCAGRPGTLDFIRALMEEWLALFPSPYFHLGGDEAGKTQWKHCPRCQEKIKKLGLKNENALQAAFINEAAAFLKSRGKTAIVWNDCLADGLDRSIICEHWTPPAIRSVQPTVDHINAGGKAIISSFRHLYFDYPYSLTPLKKTYGFQPVFPEIHPDMLDNVLGVECTLWTEWIEDEEKLWFNLLPRLAAVGEIACCPEDALNYQDFARRLPAQYELYERMGLPYAKNMEKRRGVFPRLKDTVEFYASNAYVELDHRRR